MLCVTVVWCGLLGRRAVLGGTGLALLPRAPAFAAQVYPPNFEPARIEGLGGGADLLATTPPTVADVAYPPSLNGTWVAQRRVISVEGDTAQAEGAWRLLGGTGDLRKEESYLLRYVNQAPGGSLAITGTDGRTYFGVVLDRGYELKERALGADVVWERQSPDYLRYQRTSDGGGASLRVVQRSVELPSEQGWGSNELLRITTGASTLLGAFEIDYACRVQRRWRRATLPETGARVVEGIEILKTYRVLDGVAGVEYPTSTTKSTIRLTRPT